MAHYTNITLAEMTEFLAGKGFQVIPLKVNEVVFAKRLPNPDWPLSLRVYSGITGENSKGAGEDAIRCCLFVKEPNGKITMIGGAKRVHRVEGWRKNLAERLEGWKVPTEVCPQCGLPVVPKRTRDGKRTFMSCVGFPNCRFAHNVIPATAA